MTHSKTFCSFLAVGVSRYVFLPIMSSNLAIARRGLPKLLRTFVCVKKLLFVWTAFHILL